MKIKEGTDWRENTELNWFQIIQPLLDQTLDKAKRIEIRKKASGRLWHFRKKPQTRGRCVFLKWLQKS